MTLVEIIEYCNGFLLQLPDPQLTVRPRDAPEAGPESAAAIWEFLSRAEFAERDAVDALLQGSLLDMSPTGLSAEHLFFVRTRAQSAIYHLQLLTQTLRPGDVLAHSTQDADYALEWALVRFWNCCRHQWLARVARCHAAGLTDPLAQIPADFPDWMPPEKRR